MVETAQTDPEFESLIEYIQESRGMDFRGYKRTSLRRRISARMQDVHMERFSDYQSFLEAHPQEFTDLLNTILINVTSFFRDSHAWDALRNDVLPRILGRGDRTDQIRVWSVGCASGEEPYSVAMLFADSLGISRFCEQVKIYATDLDEDALRAARHATYTQRDVEHLSPDLRERYFEHNNGNYTFQRELRKCMIFGRHNVVFDAPISRIDLLLCRNLLIYLEAETQDIVLPRLHYALVDDGILFLGKAETQLARSKLFQPIDLRHRMFRKIQNGWRRTLGGTVTVSGTRDAISADQIRLLEAVVDTTQTAHLGLDLEGKLVLANPAARRLLDVGEGDLGRPFYDLPISYRPAELRSRIDEAQNVGRPVRLEFQEYQRPPNEPVRLTIEVTPLLGRDSRQFATLISFDETTRTYLLQQELEAAQESLETTVEELQSANEELETTNEELQSTNEELETTNEELQSTNEELETMNEELRSTNDELQATNEELCNASEEAARNRAHTEAVLRSVNAGVIVLDRQFRVISWNRWNENAWGLRSEETIGRRLADLDIGLPAQKLSSALPQVLENPSAQTETTMDGLDRRGRKVRCRVRVGPLLYDGRGVHGIVLLLEDITDDARAREYSSYLGRIIGESLNEVYFLDPDTLRFTLANRGAEEKLGSGIADLRHFSLADFMPDVPLEALRGLIAPLLSGDRKEAVFETTIRSRIGREYPAEICFQYYGDEAPPFLLAIVHDVTERQRVPSAA